MKRFLNSVLCMCIAAFCTHAQKKNVTSVLEVMDITTGQRSVVKEFPFLIEAPNWTPDGNWLVYNSGGKLYKLSPESPGEPQLINSDYATRCNNDHVISADGKQIAISNGTKEDGRSRVYTLPFEGGVPRLITPLGPSYLHGWSPDGKQLAYCAERNGNFDVYVIPSLGGEEKRLTTAEGLDDGPEYSPCGQYIWFNPISPDGKQIVFITYTKGDLEPGQHLANKNVELRLMPAEGGEPKTLVKLFGGQGTINVNSWAPDSKRFAFVSYRLN